MLPALIVFLGSAVYAQSQDATNAAPPTAEATAEANAEATSDLLKKTQELLKTNQLEDALPCLEEILVRLKDLDDKRALEMRAFCMYQVGVCKLHTGFYQPAVEALEAFIAEFPDNKLIPKAMLLVGEGYANQKNWAKTEEYVRDLVDHRKFSEKQKILANQLLAGALYSQEKWEETVAPLTVIFERAEEEDTRRRAGVMLVTCYVRADDFGNLFKFLPYCNEAARNDIGLNLALIQAGDRKHAKGEYKTALVLYRMVRLKQDLSNYYQAEIKGLEQTLKKLKKPGSKKELLLARLKGDLAKLLEAKNYDLDVALRVAQCYDLMERNRPAYITYKYIYEQFPNHDLAEESRFFAFSGLLNMQDWQEALQEGELYFKLYPTGKFAEETTLNLMQLNLRFSRYDEANALGRKALELIPEHRFIDQIKYFLGYIHFHNIEYTQALTIFSEVLEQWPGSVFTEEADYWHSMCSLFLGRYDEAIPAFESYLKNQAYSQAFAEDANYRLGIAQYGAGLYDVSKETFRRFLKNYPGSDLQSEAYSMLGDLYGADGELTLALNFYKQGRKTAKNVGQVNYAVFQSATVYELKAQDTLKSGSPEESAELYHEIIRLMEGYLNEWGADGNFAGAGFWLGKSYKALGDYETALDKYFETIVRFGNDPNNADVDLILKEIVKEKESDEGARFAKVMVTKISKELARAKANGEKTLKLRIETLLALIAEEEVREQYMSSLIAGMDIEASGPLTLTMVAKEAAQRGEYALVHKAYARTVAVFEESGLLLDVMNVELDVLIREKRYPEALKLAENITDRFGYRQEVALTRKMKADAYRLMGDFDQAVETYNELFAIREWRGPLTPEALYRIGTCKLELGKPEEAFAFFQRVYVMYEGYTEWVARAYEDSVHCLQITGRHEDVAKTWREMVSLENIAATPQGKLAQRELDALSAKGVTQ